MDVSGFNESDVREEIAAPVLRALGYSKGSDADIIREKDMRLRYGRYFLGRKNPTKDPVLQGRADYVLRVAGACAWVLETKPPTEDIGIDVIEQAISYARHPEINGDLVALLNGRKFVLYKVNQLAVEDPIFSTENCAPDCLAKQLENILTPHALRRDMRRMSIDVGRSLGGGLRSREIIAGGSVTYNLARFEILECPPCFEGPFRAQLDHGLQPVIPGSRYPIERGTIERAESGRIVANLTWISPFLQLESFMSIKGLNDIRYVCMDSEISSSVCRPSTFNFYHSFRMHEGEEMFDMLRQQTMNQGYPSDVDVVGQIVGHVEGRVFAGSFEHAFVTKLHIGEMDIAVAHLGEGDFSVHV